MVIHVKLFNDVIQMDLENNYEKINNNKEK